MGQKAHPLALRQASKYRRQDHLWCSKRYRDRLLLQNLALKNYMDSISIQQQLPKSRLAVQYGHNATYIYAYTCIPFNERREIAAQCHVKFSSLPTQLSTSMWAYEKNADAISILTSHGHKVYVDGLSKSELNVWQSNNIKYNSNILVKNLTALATKTDVETVIYEVDKTWVRNKIATHLENSLNTPVHWYSIAVPSVWKDAGYLADEIVWFLERRVSFRLLKRALNRIVDNMPNILGVRVTVSGRVGGRSKKSQRARCDTWKYGATPLHVYSREIDYAQRVAHTSLGTSGVSVWLIQRA